METKELKDQQGVAEAEALQALASSNEGGDKMESSGLLQVDLDDLDKNASDYEKGIGKGGTSKSSKASFYRNTLVQYLDYLKAKGIFQREVSAVVRTFADKVLKNGHFRGSYGYMRNALEKNILPEGWTVKTKEDGFDQNTFVFTEPQVEEDPEGVE